MFINRALSVVPRRKILDSDSWLLTSYVNKIHVMSRINLLYPGPIHKKDLEAASNCELDVSMGFAYLNGYGADVDDAIENLGVEGKNQAKRGADDGQEKLDLNTRRTPHHRV